MNKCNTLRKLEASKRFLIYNPLSSEKRVLLREMEIQEHIDECKICQEELR